MMGASKKWAGCLRASSTLLGWFAVERATGRVFDWDVVDDRLGVGLRP